MRKPVYAICNQQRHRSACIFLQYYQHLFICCLDSKVPIAAISKFQDWQASIARHADLMDQLNAVFNSISVILG